MNTRPGKVEELCCPHLRFQATDQTRTQSDDTGMILSTFSDVCISWPTNAKTACVVFSRIDLHSATHLRSLAKNIDLHF